MSSSELNGNPNPLGLAKEEGIGDNGSNSSLEWIEHVHAHLGFFIASRYKGCHDKIEQRRGVGVADRGSSTSKSRQVRRWL